MQEKIAKWVHGQVLLFFLIGGITYIGLQIIGVPYALTLALIAGFAEFLPYIGPPIAFLSAAPFAFGQGVETGLFVIGLYIFIQIIEGNVLVPLVMEKTVGISPIVSILAILIGFTLLGIPGAIVAIPIVAMIQIFIGDYLSWRVENDEDDEKDKRNISEKD
jgi:predicted PurR-regulated permease PerM